MPNALMGHRYRLKMGSGTGVGAVREMGGMRTCPGDLPGPSAARGMHTRDVWYVLGGGMCADAALST